LYRLDRISNGEFLKWGITTAQPPQKRYSGKGFYDDVKMTPLEKFPNTADAAKMERFLFETRPGPWNKEVTRGIRSNELIEITIKGKPAAISK
jgi:hypothetical protein